MSIGITGFVPDQLPHREIEGLVTGAKVVGALATVESMIGIGAAIRKKAVGIASTVRDKTLEVGSAAIRVASTVKDKTVEVGTAAIGVASTVKDKTLEVGSAAIRVASTVKDKTVEVGTAAIGVASTVKDKTVEVGTAAIGVASTVKDKTLEVGTAAIGVASTVGKGTLNTLSKAATKSIEIGSTVKEITFQSVDFIGRATNSCAQTLEWFLKEVVLKPSKKEFESRSKMYEDMLAKMIRKVVRAVVNKELGKLRSFSLRDTIISLPLEPEKAKRRKREFLSGVALNLQSRPGIGSKLSAFVFNRVAFSKDTSTDLDKLKKNTDNYSLFQHFMLPLLEKSLNKNFIKLILSQTMGSASEFLREANAYAQEYSEAGGFFDEDELEGVFVETEFEEGLVQRLGYESLEQLKDEKIAKITSYLKRFIALVQKTAVPRTAKEKAGIYALGKIPDSLITANVQAVLEHIEKTIKDEFLKQIGPLLADVINIDDPKGNAAQIETYLSVFFWSSLVPAIARFVDSVSSDNSELHENVEKAIDNRLVRAGGHFMETLGSIIPQIKFKKGVTLSKIVKQPTLSKGDEGFTKLAQDIIKTLLQVEIPKAIPLPALKREIESISEVTLGTESQIYTTIGKAVITSIDLPHTVDDLVDIAKDVIAK